MALVHLGGQGHLRRLQGGLVSDPVAVLKAGGHLQLVQQGSNVLSAPVDQHHPHANHPKGGHILEGGVQGGLRPNGGATVLDHYGLPLMPIQNGQDGQQIAYLFHAVQTMLDIVLPQESLDIIHVRGGVHILFPRFWRVSAPFPVMSRTEGT